VPRGAIRSSILAGSSPAHRCIILAMLARTCIQDHTGVAGLGMGKGRLEAFTDGVIAIIITIMVLELKAPATDGLAGLGAIVPILLAYALSFVNIGIFWNNHHHMLHATRRVNGAVLWANLFLLFWLSLVPFVIRWMDDAGFTPLPTAAYGFILAMSAIGYTLLERSIIACNRMNPILAEAVGTDRKGKLSLAGYVTAIPLAFANPWIAIAIYVGVAVMWLVPDRRIESVVLGRGSDGAE
jgi:uncharacterized membrane protein